MAANQLSVCSSRGGSDGIVLRFVLPNGKNEATCSDELSEAFNQCRQYEIKPTWASEDQVLKLKPGNKDVFILDPFEGPAFEHVCQSRSIVLGPRCLLMCLAQGVTVPPFPYPMYTASMMGLVVTSTNFDKEAKNKLQRYVESMAGVYSNNFHDGVTHLVAAVVRSKKYNVAVEKDIPVMTMNWVTQVYEQGKHGNVRATDEQFVKHTCLALQGLVVCVSQMNRKDKDILKRNLERHGGVYTPTLDIDQTAILVLPRGEGDKYEYAKKWKIPCVQPQWVFDCIDKGYCLPTESYRVGGVKMSTPEKADAMKFGEVSHCSTICAPPDVTMTAKVNETLPAKLGGEANASLSTKQDYQNVDVLLEQLDLDRVGRAGKFLQGCKIFLSGFSKAEETHVNRVLISAGAAQMSQIGPSVSHVIASKRNAQLFKLLRQLDIQPHLVSLQWLVESIVMSAALPEDDFPVRALEGGSEISVGKPPTNEAPVKGASEEAQLSELEDHMLAAYGKKNDDDPACFPSESSETTITSQRETFFSGKTLYFAGFSDADILPFYKGIREAGGQVLETLSDAQKPDFLVVSTRDTKTSFHSKELVSYLYVEDCLDQLELLPIEYYHRPFEPLNSQPCRGVVLGLTTYVGKEREFIADLADSLGMLPQENFARRDKGEVKASTHLVAPSPEGSKYTAALKWNIPVITKDWLLACLEEGTWISEKPFLVGESTAFTEGKPLPQKKQSEPVNTRDEFEAEVESAVTFKTPRGSGQTSLDIDSLRPKPIALESLTTTTPSRWASQQQESHSSPQTENQAEDEEQTLASSSKKRKLEGQDDTLPFWVGDNVKTPNTPYGAFMKKDPSPITRKIWRKQSERWGEIVKGNEEDSAEIIAQYVQSDRDAKKQRQEEIREKEELSKEFDRSVVRATKRKSFDASHFDDMMEEKLQKQGKSWKNWSHKVNKVASDALDEKIERFLEGVIILVSKRLAAKQEELHALAEANGGQFRWHYSSEITHYIISGQTKGFNKELQAAKKDGKKIVCPEWLYMSNMNKKRMDEALFPSTYSSKVSLDYTMFQDTTSQGKNRGKKRYKDAATTLERKENLPESIVQPEQADNEASNFRAAMAHLDQIHKDPDASSSRRSSGISKEPSKLVLTSMEVTPGRPRERVHYESQELDSQAITWKDPKEEREKEKLQAVLDMETQHIQAKFRETHKDATQVDSMIEWDSPAAAISQPSKNAAPVPVRRHFMMSAFKDQDRCEFAKFLEEHGASASVSSECDPLATHVVALKMNRCEKLLGSIASGIWVLHGSYRSDCINAKKILPEADYEWGNPKNPYLSQLLDPKEKKLAVASFKWRTSLSEGQRDGAFSGFKVILHLPPKRKPAFQRLLQLGGARVLALEPPFSEPGDATHCLAEPAKMGPIDYEALARRGVVVLDPLYLNEYLTSPTIPKVANHFVDGFQKFWIQHSAK